MSQKRGSSEHNAHMVIAGGQRLSVVNGFTMNFMGWSGSFQG